MTSQKELAQNQINLDTATKLGEISADVKTILKSQGEAFQWLKDHEEG